MYIIYTYYLLKLSKIISDFSGLRMAFYTFIMDFIYLFFFNSFNSGKILQLGLKYQIMKLIKDLRKGSQI